MSKKISIITATYNSEDYTEKCINSVLNQTYENIEYIIIDGKSTDKTLDIVNQYKDKIKIISEEDDGNYDAIKKGFKMVSGEIITWIDSDNFYENEKVIEEIINNFNNNIDLVITNCFYQYEGSKKKHLINPEEKYFSYNYLLNRGNIFMPECVFYKKELYNKSGGLNTDYKLLSDYDLWLNIFKNKPNFIKHNIESATYVIRNNALLRKNFFKSWEETFKIGREYNRNFFTKIKFYIIFIKSLIVFLLSYPLKKNGKIRNYIIEKYY
jgi:glycosyltransferase involved in cell wall biosynthesis